MVGKTKVKCGKMQWLLRLNNIFNDLVKDDNILYIIINNFKDEVLMKKVLISILLLVTMLVTGYSDESVGILSELQIAFQIEDPFQRLKKYDSIMESFDPESLVLETSISEIDVESKWEVSVDTNPLDDTKKVSFILISEEGEPSYYQSAVKLIIRYNNDDTELYINWGEVLLGKVDVIMRIGKDEAEAKDWSLSTSRKATFYPGNVKDLITRILNEDKILFQISSYMENPKIVTFDIRSLREEATPYIEDLKWW